MLENKAQPRLRNWEQTYLFVSRPGHASLHADGGREINPKITGELGMRLGTIGQINIADAETWQGSAFITIDIDWACDEVINDTADLLEVAGASATWFVTHDSPILDRLRSNLRWELGIHPNFNFLLQGDPRNGRDAREVIDRLVNIVPEAKCVRSHALCQGTFIHQAFVDAGLTHDCNDFIPPPAGLQLSPWWHHLGLTKVPHFWEDDICFATPDGPSVSELLKGSGLKVFDFHPIHLCLNSAKIEHYNDARPIMNNYAAVCARRTNDSRGSRASMMALLEMVS